MPYEEKERFLSGKYEEIYYKERLKKAQERDLVGQEKRRRTIMPEEMPLEICSQGIIKHVITEEMNTACDTLDIFMQLIPEGSCSGKHRHFPEEYMFILEGKGYSLHWDVYIELDDKYYWKVEEEPTRWEWEEGDSVYIPPYTIHQHFNSDPEKPARFIAMESRILKKMGLDDLEQFENAPEFDQGLTLEKLFEHISHE